MAETYTDTYRVGDIELRSRLIVGTGDVQRSIFDCRRNTRQGIHLQLALRTLHIDNVAGDRDIDPLRHRNWLFSYP